MIQKFHSPSVHRFDARLITLKQHIHVKIDQSASVILNSKLNMPNKISPCLHCYNIHKIEHWLEFVDNILNIHCKKSALCFRKSSTKLTHLPNTKLQHTDLRPHLINQLLLCERYTQCTLLKYSNIFNEENMTIQNIPSRGNCHVKANYLNKIVTIYEEIIKKFMQ